MPDASPFQPDASYCVYCHAEAAGTCASCRAIVCADCSEIVTAAGKSFAVCRSCGEKTSLGCGWVALLWPILVGIAALGALVWLLRG